VNSSPLIFASIARLQTRHNTVQPSLAEGLRTGSGKRSLGRTT